MLAGLQTIAVLVTDTNPTVTTDGQIPMEFHDFTVVFVESLLVRAQAPKALELTG